ncbi:serine/threonine-protein kinase [Quadrisphaera sp. DSM 44207]|uniref:protein kinase domain-containing protein n=1 Tax=Quadrisphaera sp. DSM 44207 TaxID=1881057 RepID=UPI00088BBCC9|nr:serine/threonine-protein kinase [Quadrisphaera sp. DSM 44207]SDQ62464.1 Protein kinase domain-containing protein [Quadrisphaera sp. DSM 44207]
MHGASPSRLGPYRLLHVIGGGGMGVVHLAVDPQGRAVAVKVLRPHVAADPSARHRLAREVDTLRRVRSPHVAEVLDADPDAEPPYLVTQFVPAPPLDAHVEAVGPLAGADLARLGLGLGDALAAIHDAGVVHRDLKPGNVLVSDGDPVVIDFGIAQIADDVRLTSTGLVMGTPGYLSPEVLDGGAVTVSADWWGWAAVLAFAATGRPPFGTGPAEAVLSRVRRGEADLDGVPAPLAPVLAAALRPDPADRPTPRRLREAVQALPAAVPASSVPASSAPAASERAHPDEEDRTRVVAVPAGAAGAVTTPLLRGGAGWDERDDPDATTQVPASTAPLAAGSGAGAAGAAATRPVPAATQPVATGAPSPAAATTQLPAGTAGAPAQAAVPAPPPAPAVPWGPGPYAGHPVPGGYGAPAWPHEQGALAPPARRSGTLAALLLALVVSAAVAPLTTAILAALLGVAARTVDRVAGAAARRRFERGPRRSDGALTALGVPGHLLAALLTSVPALLLPALVGVSVAALVGWAVDPATAVAPGQSLPLAAGAAAAVLTAWWGPGSASLRSGSRRIVRAVAPGPVGAQVAVAVLVLVALAAVLVVLGNQGQPDWSPLPASPLPAGAALGSFPT